MLNAYSSMLNESELKKYLEEFSPRKDLIVDVLSGPSGIGKNWIAEQLKDSHNIVLSTTSREKRPGEDENSGYEFITPAQFEEYLKAGEFATAMIFKGNYYGYRVKNLEHIVEQGKIPLAIVYPYEVDTFLEKFPSARVWFLFPSPEKKDEYMQFLEERMRRRHEKEEVITFRLENSLQQIEDMFGKNAETSEFARYKHNPNIFMCYINSDAEGAEAAERIKNETSK